MTKTTYSGISLAQQRLLELLDEEERKLLLADLGVRDREGLEAFSSTTLLGAILACRRPFTRMMGEITGVLDELKAYLPGPIEVIALPGSDGRLQLELGPQVRQWLTLCVNEEALSQAEGELYALSRKCRAHIEKAIEECLPQSVSVPPAVFPWSQDMPYGVARRIAIRREEFFNPEDLAFFREVEKKLVAVSGITEKFAVELSRVAQLPSFQVELSELANAVSEKIAVMEQLSPIGIKEPGMIGVMEPRFRWEKRASLWG